MMVMMMMMMLRLMMMMVMMMMMMLMMMMIIRARFCQWSGVRASCMEWRETPRRGRQSTHFTCQICRHACKLVTPKSHRCLWKEAAIFAT